MKKLMLSTGQVPSSFDLGDNIKKKRVKNKLKAEDVASTSVSQTKILFSSLQTGFATTGIVISAASQEGLLNA